MTTTKREPTPYQRRLALHLAEQDKRVVAERNRLAALTPEQRQAEIHKHLQDIGWV